MDLINVLLGALGFICAVGVKQLMAIAKSVNEIKTDFGILRTKHDYIEGRVKHLEQKLYEKDKRGL
jgi:hypothetical protein